IGLCVLLFCAGIADAEFIGPFPVTSGFFDAVLTSTWDGVFLIAGDNFSMGGNGQNNFDPSQLPVGHSNGGTGTATVPLTFNGITFPNGMLNMRFPSRFGRRAHSTLPRAAHSR